MKLSNDKVYIEEDSPIKHLIDNSISNSRNFSTCQQKLYFEKENVKIVSFII